MMTETVTDISYQLKRFTLVNDSHYAKTLEENTDQRKPQINRFSITDLPHHPQCGFGALC